MSNIIGLNTKLFGLEKNIKQSEPTRAANDLEQLGDPAKKERVLNSIVSESYMKKYIEEHGGGGGLDLKKTTLTLLNTSEDTVSLDTLFTEAINYFVYDEIDGDQIPITAFNVQIRAIDIVDYLKSLSIAPNETIVIELYYCCKYDGRPMSALGCVSNIGTSLVNMTWDSEYSEYLINDITADSAITIDVNDLPK